MGNAFMHVDEVAKELEVSKSYAYKLVRRLNAELQAMGYITVPARVSKKYFYEKMCYGSDERSD